MKTLFLLKKAQQEDYKISVNGLTELYNYIINNPEHPQQNYLFEGPEINRFQNINKINRNKLKTIINAMTAMLYIPHSIMNGNIEIDENVYDWIDRDYIAENYYEYISDSKDEFISYLNNHKEDYKEQIQENIKEFFDDGFNYRVHEDDKRAELVLNVLNNFKSYYSVDDTLYRDIINALNEEDENKWESVSDALGIFLTDLYINDWIDLDDLKISIPVENNKFSSTLKSKLIDEDNIISTDDVLNEYIERNYDSLLREMIQSQEENDLSEFSYNDRHLMQDLGIFFKRDNDEIHSTSKYSGIIDALVSIDRDSFNENDLEIIKNLELKDWKDIADLLYSSEGRNITGAAQTAMALGAHILFINNLVESDLGLKNIFSSQSIIEFESDSQMEQVFSEYEKLKEDFEEYAKNNLGVIPEELKGGIDISKHNEELAKKLEYLNRFKTNTTYTPEQLEQLKQMGIKPFNLSGNMEVSKQFPGVGAFNDKNKNLTSFTLSIHPESLKDIPDELFKEMTLHKSIPNNPSEGFASALGWIGGFIDHKKKSVYISEVQSDVLQRTFDMKDPNILIEQKKKEIQQLENEKLKYSQPKDFSFAIQKIQNQLNSVDKNSPQFNNLQNQLQILEQKSKQPQDNSSKLQELDNNIISLQKDIEKLMNTKGGRFSQYHQYKSKIENLYQDWIEMFFNTVMRYVVNNDVNLIYIITPQSLMVRWANYAKKETKIIFERIYDKMAKYYNAKESNGWFVVKKDDILEKVAFTKLQNIKTSSIEEIYKLDVLKENYIRFNSIANQNNIPKFTKVAGSMKETYCIFNQHLNDNINDELNEDILIQLLPIQMEINNATNI